MKFDLEDLVYPWTIEGVVLVAFLGFAMGVAIAASEHRLNLSHAYWIAAGGIVFFVPVAVLREIQGHEHWERLLGIGVFWMIYVAAMLGGARIVDWIRRH